MSENTEGIIGAIVSVVFIVGFILYFVFGIRGCLSEEKAQAEFRNWCAHIACPGKELVSCHKAESFAICKGTDGQEIIIRR
jgi:hypothetical protein